MDTCPMVLLNDKGQEMSKGAAHINALPSMTSWGGFLRAELVFEICREGKVKGIGRWWRTCMRVRTRS